VLGAQANMWTHLARNERAIDEQIFPRLCALAEVVWSPAQGRNWDNFQTRMKEHEEQLKRASVSLHRDVVPPIFPTLTSGVPWVIFSDGTSQCLTDGKWAESVWIGGGIRSVARCTDGGCYTVDDFMGVTVWPIILFNGKPIETGFTAVQLAVDEGDNLWAVDKDNVPHAGTFKDWQTVWQTMPGKVRQIAASKGNLWALGTEPVAGGYDILKWTGADWKLVSPGAAAIQLSAADGVLWAVNGGGVGWKWDGANWTPYSGTIQAIAAAPNGAVWALRLDSAKNQWLPLTLKDGAWAEAGPGLPAK
jgi:hypothetical protein